MFEEYELSISFSSRKLSTLDAKAFGKLQTFFKGTQATIHIVDESQVTDVFSALHSAGIRPRKFYLSSRHRHAEEIDAEYLIGAIPSPEEGAIVANTGLACRMFIPADVGLCLASRPAQSRPFTGARNRHVMNAVLAAHCQTAADAVIHDIVIDGEVSSVWKEVQFQKFHDILHVLPGLQHFNCRWCGVASGLLADTLIGRHENWSDSLYCDSLAHGHGFKEHALFVPIDHISEFKRLTKRDVQFRPVFSDTVGPGSIAFRVLSNSLRTAPKAMKNQNPRHRNP